jgi:DNA modification methylase
VKPYYERGAVAVYHGDNREVMAELDDTSIDAIVCDPPYGLEFMGKEWDKMGDVRQPGSDDYVPARPENPFGRISVRYGGTPSYASAGAASGPRQQEWHRQWVEQALRVLKPGGHLLAFGGSRTYHRLACAVEDAGFEIRDSMMWLYGSGFPKSMDVSKQIDKQLGVERTEVVGTRTVPDAKKVRPHFAAMETEFPNATTEYDYTKPASDEAKQWEGWGTALKPAHEPIVVGRKPIVGTVADNVMQHGTGALNIDGCRVGSGEGVVTFERHAGNRSREQYRTGTVGESTPSGIGRWPSNVILSHHSTCQEVGERKVKTGTSGGRNQIIPRGPDFTYADEDGTETVPVSECVEGCPVAEIDRQSGTTRGKIGMTQHGSGTNAVYGKFERTTASTIQDGVSDWGGASRFFYVAKAGSGERGEGLHPTVKPVALMRHLIRLVTPPDGVVLDPFLGSGSTGVAAVREGVDFIGIEMTTEPDMPYVKIATVRIDSAITYLAEPQAMF